jgi:hypothetical protein
VPNVENVTKAAGIQTVKEPPAAVIGRASLAFIHYWRDVSREIGILTQLPLLHDLFHELTEL